MQICNQLPAAGYLRLWQIVGDPGDPEAKPPVPPTPPIFPVSRSTWWLWVKQGKAPRPVKLSERVTAWRVEDIKALLARQAA